MSRGGQRLATCLVLAAVAPLGCGGARDRTDSTLVVLVEGPQAGERGAAAAAADPLAWLRPAPTAIERDWVRELRGVLPRDERPVAEVLADVERMTQKHAPLPQPFAALIATGIAGLYAELAQSYRAQGAERLARQASDEALSRYRLLLAPDAGLPDDASMRSVRYQLARELERRGNVGEALAEYRRYLDDGEDDPERPQASVAVAEALIASGAGTDDERRQAYELYERATSEAYRDNPLYVLCCCRLGQLALARRHFDAAEQAFRKALAHAVEHPHERYARELSEAAREGLVAAHAATGDPRQAYQQFRERNAADERGTQDTSRMIALLAWHYHRARRYDSLIGMIAAALPLAQGAEEPGVCALAAKLADALAKSATEADRQASARLAREHRAQCAAAP